MQQGDERQHKEKEDREKEGREEGDMSSGNRGTKDTQEVVMLSRRDPLRIPANVTVGYSRKLGITMARKLQSRSGQKAMIQEAK